MLSELSYDAEGHRFEFGLGLLVTGKLVLSTSCKWVPFSNRERIEDQWVLPFSCCVQDTVCL